MIKIGNREFATLIDALDTIDKDNSKEVLINLNERVHGQIVIDKPNVKIIGGTIENNLGACELMDDGYKRGTFRTYSLFIDADNVTLENLTIINSNGYKNGQAIALMVNGNNFKAKNCLISSYQDTLFIGPLPEQEYEEGGFKGPLENREKRYIQTRFENCLIQGSVDFIFGGGLAYFENCEIKSLNIHKEINGYVCAPSTPKDKEYGFIFNKCKFTSEVDMDDSVYLARPWRDYGKCLIVNSEIGKHIKAEGYHDWNKVTAKECCEFKEFNNKNLNFVERVEWIKKVNDNDLQYINLLEREKKDERYL